MYPVYQLINPAIATPICLIAIPLMFIYAWLRDKPASPNYPRPKKAPEPPKPTPHADRRWAEMQRERLGRRIV
jgi:hypothetical protein